MNGDGPPSLEELRAEAARRGITADDADLEGVRAFLTVFLPAVDELAGIVPADAAPAPLD